LDTFWGAAELADATMLLDNEGAFPTAIQETVFTPANFSRRCRQGLDSQSNTAKTASSTTLQR